MVFIESQSANSLPLFATADSSPTEGSTKQDAQSVDRAAHPDISIPNTLDPSADSRDNIPIIRHVTLSKLPTVLVMVSVGAGFYVLGRFSASRSRLRKTLSSHSTFKRTSHSNVKTGRSNVEVTAHPHHRSPQQSDLEQQGMHLSTIALNATHDGEQDHLTPTQESGVSKTTRLAKVNIAQSLIHDLQSQDPTIRRQAIWGLGQRGTTDAITPLMDLMVNVDSQQRSLILAAIAEIGIRTLKPMSRALLTSLQDESSDVRKNAIRDMARVYELMNQASVMLHHAANDENNDVRETACWAMERLNRMRVAPKSEGMEPSFKQIQEYSVNENSIKS